MKIRTVFKVFCGSLLLSTLQPQLSTVQAQGTAFTYQGRLNDGGSPANGAYDLTFTLFGVSSGGSSLAGPVTNSAVGVTNGLFITTLDFGANFPGTDRWLEIGARSNATGAFTTLIPRQKLTATPYAVTAGNVTGPVGAAQLSGTLALAQLPGAVVTNNQTGVNLTGTFSGNGAGVTNVNLLSLNSDGLIGFPGLFQLSSSPGVGNGPYSIAAADVNGDGKVDLISANVSASTLTVLTNNGSGSFVLAASPGVGSTPYSVAVGDVNGDSKADLISANVNSDTLTVLTNNGADGFLLASSPGVGHQPVSVVAADLNSDGKVDLVCANYGSNTLSVLTNNGSGTFVLVSSLAVGSRPASVAAADVNGDGKVDLISANQFSNTLSVLTNNGSGGFVLASSPAVGLQPISVVGADLNGDGKADLVSANFGTNTLTVLTNNGSGGFVLAGTFGVGNAPASVAAADVNGDGKLDLISANLNANTLSVLTNNGSGGFVLASSPSAGSPISVVAADVSGDGKIDSISANFNANTLSVLFNTAIFTGNCLYAPRMDLNTNGAPNVIGGAPLNMVDAGVLGATIGGGGAINYQGFANSNRVASNFGTIGGGEGNTIQTNAPDSTIGGGVENLVQADASTIGGGNANIIGTNAPFSTIGGGDSNAIELNASVSTIAGGDSNTIKANAHHSTIAGGVNNATDAHHSMIGGGQNNTIEVNAQYSTIGGGEANTIQMNASDSTIGGGSLNTTFGRYAAIPGGDRNVAGTSSFAAGHRAKATHTGAFVWADSADADFASTATNQFLIRASGGMGIGTAAPESEMHIFRGSAGTVTANTSSLLTLENDNNAFIHILAPSNAVTGILFGTPLNSLDASMRYNNLGDRELSFRTVNSTRMTITTNGFVGIGTTSPTNRLHVAGGVSATAFVNTSDRNAKENFQPVNPRAVLEKVATLPITTWTYKEMPDGRHMGPVAQDFHAAFGLGGSATTITTIDPDGVALAAIQGLNQKLDEKEARIVALEKELAELKRLLLKGNDKGNKIKP